MVKDLSTMAKLTTQVKKDPFTFKKHGKVKKKEKHGKRMKKKENNLREQLSIGGSVKQIIDNANAVAGGSTNGEKKIKKNKNKFHKLQDNEISSTTQSTNEVTSNVPSDVHDGVSRKWEGQRSQFQSLWENYKPRTTPLIGAGTDWHTQLIKESGKERQLDMETKKKLKELAAKILENDVAVYNQNEERGSKRQEVKFRKTVLSHGTSRDKLAAHVLRCMEAPVHSLNHLTALISMVTPKARGGYEEAFSSLTDLFESAYLPKARVARKFENHNFNVIQPFIVANREQAERQLALWYFEDQLAVAYEKLVRHLKQISHDTVDKNKMKGIKSLITLLGNNPIQETELILESVVNKLGDPSKKVASQTMYLIRMLLQRRPILKTKVVMFTEIVLYRPNIAEKAQYYCLCFLKDIIFGKDAQNQELAKKLLKLYFGFFRACTKKGEVDTRLMSALLRGIKRAYPFSGMEDKDLDEQLETLYKICHLVNFSIASQALQLIYQLLSSKNHVPDRFYNVLYRKLQDKAFGQSSANSAFLNLVFKALVRDESLNRIKAFIKRLLQMSTYQTSNVACGILYLISEVMKEKPDLYIKDQPLYQKTLDDDDDDGEVYEDVKDEDDDDSKSDDEVEEKNKIKRESEDYRKLGSQQNNSQKFNKEKSGNLAASQTNSNQAGVASSWVHLPSKGQEVKGTNRSSYDPNHRNPMYCGSEFSPVWELHSLKKHFHPTVLLFANRILAKEPLNYFGDPLQDFTQMRFLDKFVFRNPKKLDTTKDSAGGNVFGSRMQYAPQGARALAVTDDEYLEMDLKSVPEEEHFLYKYVKEYKVKKDKAKGEEEDDEVNDDEFEAFLNKMGGPPKEEEEEISEEFDFAGCATGKLDDEDNALNSDDEMIDDNVEDIEEMDDGENDDEMGEISEEDDISDEDDDLDDEELIKTLEQEDEELENMDDDDELDFNEEDIAYSDEDDFGPTKPMKKKMEKVKGGKKSSKKELEDLSSMFADAEDFAHLLEDNDEDEYGITSQAVMNRDRSHAKQLKWEKNRDHMDKGFDRWQNKRGKQPGARGRGSFRGSHKKSHSNPKRGKPKFSRGRK